MPLAMRIRWLDMRRSLQHSAQTMIQRIVSGGQTGADRSALDWAISRGIPHGGWCPKGRKAEDEKVPPQYDLQETASTSYASRTEMNVLESDGTVIFSLKPLLSGGSLQAAEFAAKHGKPLLHLHAGSRDAARKLIAFVQDNGIRTLNVAGPRASAEPTIASFVTMMLDKAFPIPPS
jgi:hypothetical protein